jgi:hypothetical protein
MALVELSMLEQRYLAARECSTPAPRSQTWRPAMGVDRRTLRRWLLRYANDGIGALVEKSSKPDRYPYEI